MVIIALASQSIKAVSHSTRALRRDALQFASKENKLEIEKGRMNRIRIARYGFFAYGLVMMTGLFFVFIPSAAMSRIGEALDLPDFEASPVFEYMARTLSFVAFLSGALLIFLGAHLEDYTRLIRFVGWCLLAFLPIPIFIHIKVSTPIWLKVGGLLGVALLCALCFVSPKKPPKP